MASLGHNELRRACSIQKMKKGAACVSVEKLNAQTLKQEQSETEQFGTKPNLVAKILATNFGVFL